MTQILSILPFFITLEVAFRRNLKEYMFDWCLSCILIEFQNLLNHWMSTLLIQLWAFREICLHFFTIYAKDRIRHLHDFFLCRVNLFYFRFFVINILVDIINNLLLPITAELRWSTSCLADLSKASTGPSIESITILFQEESIPTLNYSLVQLRLASTDGIFGNTNFSPKLFEVFIGELICYSYHKLVALFGRVYALGEEEVDFI